MQITPFEILVASNIFTMVSSIIFIRRLKKIIKGLIQELHNRDMILQSIKGE